MSLEDRLAELSVQAQHLHEELSRPEVSSDPDALRRIGKELARIEPTVGSWERLVATRHELEQARTMRDGDVDPDVRDMARDEVHRLEADEARLVEELKVQLLPHDPLDERDVIVELRAGTGGEEAALFAAELFRMYVRYAERHRWSVEVLSTSETGIGGLREVIFEVHGERAYSRLKFEGGVHRVQRVPETE
jgi:peptide chain release factor 1